LDTGFVADAWTAFVIIERFYGSPEPGFSINHLYGNRRPKSLTDGKNPLNRSMSS
jgi:hypothetical protein